MMTTPCTLADRAIAGYSGFTSLTFVGGLMLPPTRTRAGGGGRVGSTSDAIEGMIITAPTSTVCTMIDSGTVYHFWPATLTEGSTTSPNMSRGTDPSLLVIYCKSGESIVQERQEAPAARGADYSQSIIQCQTKTLLRLDTGTPQMASVRPASPGVSEKSSDFAPFGRGGRLGRDLNRP